MKNLELSTSKQRDDGDKKKSQSSNINDTHTTISYPLPNNLLAIFKVRFHVHRGNELVWQYPHDIDLQGVEYQLICSGLHLIKKDTIYFSRWNGIGVGVFENREIDHDRGANMQAIGVLIASPSTAAQPLPIHLWQHVSFLETQLARTLDEDKVDTKTEHHELEDYYCAHKYRPVSNKQSYYYITPVSLNERYFQPFESVPFALTYYIESCVFPLSSERLQQQQQWHIRDPARAFSEMVQSLGPSVFILWKAILLKQRILMMKSTPPMEQICYFVYNAYLMDQWQSLTTPRIKSRMALKFNIGISDISQMEKHSESYIACTSDTIFDFKKDLYDVLIKFPTNNTTTNAIVTPSSPISVNAADHVRYNHLMHLFPLPNNGSTTTTTTITTPKSPSTWTYYRYDWMTWWEAMTRQSGFYPSVLPAKRTQRYPLYQQNRNSGGSSSMGSMHTLEDTAFSTSATTTLIAPSSLPLTSSQEVLMGDEVTLEDSSRFLSSDNNHNNGTSSGNNNNNNNGTSSDSNNNGTSSGSNNNNNNSSSGIDSGMTNTNSNHISSNGDNSNNSSSGINTGMTNTSSNHMNSNSSGNNQGSSDTITNSNNSDSGNSNNIIMKDRMKRDRMKRAQARALIYNSRPDQSLAWGSAPSVLPDTLNNTLLGFFHVLTLQLISTLQTYVDNVDDQEEEVILGMQDMIKLGLDPWDDRYLVEQLGLIYFDKRISVSMYHGLGSYCCGCCGSSCCGSGDGPIQL